MWQALYNWNSEKSEVTRHNINFYAVYIPTDIYWDVKNHTYSYQLKGFGDFAERISSFSVNSNVFTSLCDTFINIIKYELKDEDLEKELEISHSLIKAWKLNNNTIPQLKYIKEALNERIDDVNQLIQRLIFNHKNGDEIPHPDFFDLSFESSLELLIPKFQRIYELDDSKKWALCFDELEFAPLWLQKKLFKSLRSRKQYLLFKLSASPVLSLELEKSLLGEYRATSGNDVEMIKMWNASDKESFSIQIIQSRLKDGVIPREFLGENEIYSKGSGSYVEGSNFYIQLLELIEKDVSFKNFLLSKDVNINKPVAKDDGEKNTLFRKIKPIVYHRNAIISKNTGITSQKALGKRSRKKVIDLYSGIEVFRKVCDGNPRWLIGIINQILVKNKKATVSKRIQYNELLEAAKKFKNVIDNIPIGDNPKTLTELIASIAKYQYDQLLGSKFQMDPYGTFIVDRSISAIPNNYVQLIEKGISQGAFILVDSNNDSFDFEIRGQRIKLSFLFYILYSLPIRMYNATNLSDCFKGNNNQPTLFNS